MNLLVTGKKQSGKSTWAKHNCKWAYDRGHGTLVYSPHRQNWDEWEASLITDDPEKFIQWVKQAKKWWVYLDEAQQVVPHYANDQYLEIANSGRHLGHNFVYTTRRHVKVDKDVQECIDKVITFKIGRRDAKKMAEEFALEAIKDVAPDLDKYQYMKCGFNDYTTDYVEPFPPEK